MKITLNMTSSLRLNIFGIIIIVIFIGRCNCAIDQSVANSPRISASAIAQQLGFGAKRTLHYLNTLVESCDNVGNLNAWVVFLQSHLTCEEQAQQRQEFVTKSSASKRKDDEPVQRRLTDEFCAAWPRRRKCSSRLASKLDSCLGSRLEDGRAGTNALRLADAHTNFICHHKFQYTGALESTTEMTIAEDVNNNEHGFAWEKLPLACFRKLEGTIEQCVQKREVLTQQVTFCQKFQVAKECLVDSFKMCDNENARAFLKSMLGQLEFDLKCSSL